MSTGGFNAGEQQCNGLESHSRGKKKYRCSLHATETGDKRCPDGPFSFHAEFTFS